MAISSHPGLTSSYPAGRLEVTVVGGSASIAPKPTQSARWLAALVENSSDSTIGVDDRGILQSWNAGAQRCLATRQPK